MTAAYRLKGIGWFAVLAAVALGFYLVSLQVAAERKKLDDVTFRIADARRDIRALETEFDTRGNMQQLERWNGDTLALVAPTAAQFVPDDAALASLDPNALGQPEVRTAALVMPSITVAAPLAVAAATPPVQVASSTGTVAAPVAAPAPAPVQPRTVSAPVVQRVALAVAPTGRSAPQVARMVEAQRGAAAVAKVRPQAVALLDRQLLSDTTFGDIMSGARREARR